MEFINSVLSNGVVVGIAVFILHGYISNQYSKKLEAHKSELILRLEKIKNANESKRLSTSLFFDYQRNAFAGLLAKIAEVNQKWVDETFAEDEGLRNSVPGYAYNELQSAYYQNQLFLDSSCLAAMELVFDCYRYSFCMVDEKVNRKKVGAAYAAIEYLQPRLAELFQNRIGVTESCQAEHEIAILGAVRLVDKYYYKLNLPTISPFKFQRHDEIGAVVIRAEKQVDELILLFKQLHEKLKEDEYVSHKDIMQANRFLTILEPNKGI